MKQFRLTVTALDGSKVYKIITRKTLEDAMIASAGFVGAFCNDDNVREVTVREIRPMLAAARVWQMIPGGDFAAAEAMARA